MVAMPQGDGTRMPAQVGLESDKVVTATLLDLPTSPSIRDFWECRDFQFLRHHTLHTSTQLPTAVRHSQAGTTATFHFDNYVHSSNKYLSGYSSAARRRPLQANP